MSLEGQLIKLLRRMTDIEGSKPRKFITKTKLTNPSLYSLSITSLLDPENSSLSKIYQALEKKQQHTLTRESRLYQLSPQKSSREPLAKETIPRQSSNIDKPVYKEAKDSLQQAQKEFEKSKANKELRANANSFQKQGKEPLGRQASYGSMISRGSSLPSLMSFHYRTDREIIQKQQSQYNIISNL